MAGDNAFRWCKMCKTIVNKEQWEELGPHRRREGNSGVKPALGQKIHLKIHTSLMLNCNFLCILIKGFIHQFNSVVRIAE